MIGWQKIRKQISDFTAHGANATLDWALSKIGGNASKRRAKFQSRNDT
jgi:hypothetical protein